jgi:hypothetical protein
VVLVIAAGWFLIDSGGLDLLRHGQTQVNVGVSLTPDATGTLVEVLEESPDSSLPQEMDIDLARSDDATVTQGSPATGLELHYSDVSDGFGAIPAAQVRSAHLTRIHTDGRRLHLIFHVDSIQGRRIVYPIPRSSRISWMSTQLYINGVRSSCSGNVPGSAAEGTFVPCAMAATDMIDGSHHTLLRLELTP